MLPMRAPLRPAITLLLTTMLTACAPHPAVGQDRGAGESAQAAAAALDPMISRIFALNVAPGMAVAVVRDTQIIYLKGFGVADIATKRPMTPQTVSYIASTTKAFTALAALLLERRGVLDLDAAVSRYLPALRLQSPLAPDSITLRMLLSHTHGISNVGPVVWRTAFTGEFAGDQLVKLMAEHPPESTGRAYRYSNIGYNLASFAMDAVTGTSWRDVLERELFAPLGMRSTTAYVSRVPRERLAMPYRPDETGFVALHYAKGDESMQAAGGLVSTAEDLATWLEANINQGRVNGRQVIPAAAIEEAHRQHATTRQSFRGVERFGYALGWNLATYGGDTLYEHGGGFPGFAAHVSFMPRSRLGVAVVANGGGIGGILPMLVSLYVYDKLRGRPGADTVMADTLRSFAAQAARQRQAIGADRARRAARPQTLPHPLAAYAGVYENPLYGRMEWRVVNGKLEVRAGRLWSVAEVFDGEKNQLRVELQPGQGEVVTFHFDGGRASAVTYSEQTYRRIG
jgi:CubicO group peptidase (beta-lactamase class C family)